MGLLDNLSPITEKELSFSKKAYIGKPKKKSSKKVVKKKTPVKKKMVKKKIMKKKSVKKKTPSKKMIKKKVLAKGPLPEIVDEQSSPEMQKGILKEAMADINKEIARINIQKRKLNQQILDADSGLELSRRAERRLQERIAELLEKEASLKEKKKKVTQSEETLSDKLLKIQKIKSELSDV